MRILLFFTFICFILFSCTDKNEVPKGILPASKMQAILTDILIADGFNNERVQRDSALKLPVENASSFKKVFELHKISRDEFIKSYNFYLNRPDLFRVVSDSVSAIIVRQNEIVIKDSDSIKSKPNGNNLKKITGPTGSRQ